MRCIMQVTGMIFLAASLCCEQASGAGSSPVENAARQVPVQPASQTSYRIGPADILKITVWDGQELETQTLEVADDGTLLVPFGINRTLPVQGLTPGELKQALRQQLERFFRQPEVQVIVEQYRARRAYLLGAIQGQPGLYPLEGPKRVLEFIIEHGGFAANASIQNVQINRASGEVETVNLSEVIFRGDDSQNLFLRPGDVVWVPSREAAANTYFVFGEVNTPGIIQSDGPISVIEAVSLAGSLNRDASREGVFVVRGDLQRPEVLQVDFEQILRKADFSQVVTLQDRDIIFVTRSGAAKFRDVLQTISPILSVLRDAALLGTIVN